MLTAHSNIHNTTDSLPFTCPLIHPLIMEVQAWNNAAYDYLAGNSRLRAVLGQHTYQTKSTPDAAETTSGSRSIDNAAIRASYFEESSTKKTI
ncbi:hypothetical protein ACLKA7_009821 [Drosophila subpalustris]